MNCPNCHNVIADGSNFCSYCGAKIMLNQVNISYNNQQYIVSSGKSRIAYILLGIFLGSWGIHNFYAGYTDKAIIQLVLGLISCGMISAIWAIIDVCTVTCDANGFAFTD